MITFSTVLNALILALLVVGSLAIIIAIIAYWSVHTFGNNNKVKPEITHRIKSVVSSVIRMCPFILFLLGLLMVYKDYPFVEVMVVLMSSFLMRIENKVDDIQAKLNELNS